MKKKEGGREIRICRWSIAGLTETEVGAEIWRKVGNKVSKNHNWLCIPAYVHQIQRKREEEQKEEL